MDFQPFAKPYGDEDRRFQINLNDDGTFKSLKYGGKPEYLNTIKAWASLYQIKEKGSGAYVNTEVISFITLVACKQF